MKDSICFESSRYDEVEDEIDHLTLDKKGIVNCRSLRVRKEPSTNSEVVSIVFDSDEVLIDESKSTDDFYAVVIGDVPGFCMKKFITII